LSIKEVIENQQTDRVRLANRSDHLDMPGVMNAEVMQMMMSVMSIFAVQ